MIPDEIIDPQVWAEAVKRRYNENPLWLYWADDAEGLRVARALLAAYLFVADAPKREKRGMLLHSCVADSAPEDKFPEDHEAERAARRVIEGLGGWMDIRTAPQDGTHILVRFEGTMSPPTVAHWFGPPDLPGLRAGGWYLSVQQLEGPAIHPTHWRHVPS